MDKLHDWYGRNSVKKTMLKHEEIFREQVCELHRLYRVQKSLMTELRNECKIQYYGDSPTLLKSDVRYQCVHTEPKMEYQNSSSSSNASTYQYNNLYPVMETCVKDRRHWFQVRDFASQNATCSSSDISRSQRRSFDLERPAEECASDDVSTAHGKEINALQKPISTKMCIGNLQARFVSSDQDINVELTLRTGGNKDVQKKTPWWECPNPEFGCSVLSSIKSKQPMPSSNLDWPESLRQPTTEKERFVVTDSGKNERNDPFDRESLQQPPWMFQALPLHRRL